MVGARRELVTVERYLMIFGWADGLRPLFARRSRRRRAVVYCTQRFDLT